MSPVPAQWARRNWKDALARGLWKVYHEAEEVTFKEIFARSPQVFDRILEEVPCTLYPLCMHIAIAKTEQSSKKGRCF